MNHPAEDYIARIDSLVEEKRWEIDGVNLSTALTVHWWLESVHREDRGGRGISSALKQNLRLSLGKLREAFGGPSSASVHESPAASSSGIRHLAVMGFPPGNRMLHEVEALAQAYRPRGGLGILTSRLEVFDALKSTDIPVFLLETPSLSSAQGVPFRGFSALERVLLAQAVLQFRSIETLLDRLAPLTVLTAQDFHPFDHVATLAARKKGIHTVTHQHGMIPTGHRSLYSLVYSDRIAVWGERSARTLRGLGLEDRIWIVGTSRFKDLVPPKEPLETRPYLALALNATTIRENRLLLSRVVEGMVSWPCDLHGLTPLLKLHPSMDIAQWKGICEEVTRQAGVSWRFDVTADAAALVLPQTRFLLAHRSTISMDGALLGCSLLELQPREIVGDPPAYFEHLPESVVLPEFAGTELIRRLEDPDHHASVLERQAQSLALEFAAQDSVAVELAYLHELEEKS